MSTPKYEKKMHLIHYYDHPLVKGFPGRKLKMSCKEHISHLSVVVFLVFTCQVMFFLPRYRLNKSSTRLHLLLKIMMHSYAACLKKKYVSHLHHPLLLIFEKVAQT